MNVKLVVELSTKVMYNYGGMYFLCASRVRFCMYKQNNDHDDNEKY